MDFKLNSIIYFTKFYYNGCYKPLFIITEDNIKQILKDLLEKKTMIINHQDNH